MKVLILGGSGMLGHKLWQTCSQQFETYVSLRGALSRYRPIRLFEQSRVFENVVAEDVRTVTRAIDSVRPSVIVNCVGIVKQDTAARDPVASITVNSLFPHRISQLIRNTDIRLIHLSTDCVFSGSKGNYSEDDMPDPVDLYGRSKLLGEVAGARCLTIRTSMIGRELKGSHGLLEWFLSQRAPVSGFRRAIFSGFTTQSLAGIIARVIAQQPNLSGLWHVGSDPISKFDLLNLVKQTYGLAVDIRPEDTFVCDRSLNSSRFRAETGINPPSWPEMITRMAIDPTPYEEIRRKNDS